MHNKKPGLFAIRAELDSKGQVSLPPSAVEAFMNLLKLLVSEVSVNLCCRNIAVPEHLLHATQVGTIYKQIGSE